MLNRKQKINSFLLCLLCALVAPVASADLYEIIATPQQTSGGFRHNVFHSAHRNNAMSGSIKAWMDLDTSQTSTYNSDTGELEVFLNLYSNSNLNTVIGTAVGRTRIGMEDTMMGSEFNQFDNQVIGEINWAFDFNNHSSSLAKHLKKKFGYNANAEYETTMHYVDRNFTTSADGHTANTFNDPFITLWGANGWYSQNKNKTFGANLGSDIVMELRAVPAPGALVLGAMGIATLTARKKRKANQAA